MLIEMAGPSPAMTPEGISAGSKGHQLMSEYQLLEIQRAEQIATIELKRIEKIRGRKWAGAGGSAAGRRGRTRAERNCATTHRSA